MKYPTSCNPLNPKTEFYNEVIDSHKEAVKYISSFNWCTKVIGADLYFNLGSKLCLFIFEIENSASNDDNFIWIIVGDLPSAYLDSYSSDSVKDALRDYAALADDWIENVKAGKSVEYCYPFNAEPTSEMADLLERRTSLIKNNILPNINDIQFKGQLKRSSKI